MTDIWVEHSKLLQKTFKPFIEDDKFDNIGIKEIYKRIRQVQSTLNGDYTAREVDKESLKEQFRYYMYFMNVLLNSLGWQSFILDTSVTPLNYGFASESTLLREIDICRDDINRISSKYPEKLAQQIEPEVTRLADAARRSIHRGGISTNQKRWLEQTLEVWYSISLVLFTGKVSTNAIIIHARAVEQPVSTLIDE
ncbi:MAG: hypothetical protein K8L99_28970 [Anaerolineae bacterium]|nr:hypothetical protein [Anaerolineae bacterium]